MFQIHNGDCAEVMASMESNSVDAIVTDPPYGLAFMGVAWDTFGDGRKGGGRSNATFDQVGGNHHPPCSADQARTRKSENAKFQAAMTPIFEEALRVAKPGAHLLCFGGTRTFHRMACAIEDAGWEIRDSILWVWSYGQGFPKSMDVAKAIDKSTGYVGEVIGERTVDVGMQGGHMHAGRKQQQQQQQVRALSDQAKQWEGWGTCLKPAWEPIIVARKPLDGTVAHNVLTWGVGAMNIDACRVEYESESDREQAKPQGAATSKIGALAGKSQNEADRTEFVPTQKYGRFPANLVHDGSQMVLDLFPQSKGQQGDVVGSEPSRPTDGVCYGEYNERQAFARRGDSGSAARFFYCAKASKKERGEGNHHPTVKPIALMKWLVKLVTPEGGVVLDPFAGSGTTLVACKELGRSCIGIEREPEYVEIIKRRLETT